jgi:EmrB/QacA subfamily drug resistance transporter
MSATAPTAVPATGTPHAPYRATYAVLAIGSIAYALLQSLVTPVLHTIQVGLNTSQNSVTWVLTAYLVSASVFTPIMGRLGDMFGKQRMLVFALVALGIGAFLAAIAPSITVMIIARVIQGVGGGVLPLSYGIVRDEFPAQKVAGTVGVLSALIAAGVGLGAVIAGPIVDVLNYHWLFWIPMVAVFAAAAAAFVVIPESPVRTPGKLNWVAAILMSGWLVALLVGISEAPTWGWGSPKVIGLVVLAAILAVIWIAVESRSAQPLIDMKMMRIPAVWTSNLVSFLFGIGMYASVAFLPEFLQTSKATGYGFGLSITQSGLVLLPMSALMFFFGVASGPLAERYTAKAVLVVGSAISIANYVILALAHAELWQILIAMAIQGIGLGLVFATLSSIVVRGVPAEQTGVASGMNANIRTIGGAIGAAVMSSIVTSGVTAGGLPHESGYTKGFGVLALASIGAFLASLLVPVLRNAPSGPKGDTLPHAEMAMVAGGTLAGDLPE